MHAPATPSQLRAIFLFSGAYMACAVYAAFATGNDEFVFYIVTMTLIIVGLWAVHRRVGLSGTLLWCLSLWGLLHMIGGLVPIPAGWHDESVTGVVYNFWIIPGYIKYDQAVHAYGFGITTLLCWQALSARVLGEDGKTLEPTPGLMVLCAAGGMGFGALNEVIEFFATLCIAGTNVGGYENTGWDLVSNFLGASSVALIIHLRHRARMKTPALDRS